MYTTGIGSTRSSHFAANDTVAYLYRTLPRRCHTEDTTYVTITDNLTCLVENEVADVYGCSITVAVLGKRLVLHAVNDANETDTLEVRIVDDEVGDDMLLSIHAAVEGLCLPTDDGIVLVAIHVEVSHEAHRASQVNVSSVV